MPVKITKARKGTVEPFIGQQKDTIGLSSEPSKSSTPNHGVIYIPGKKVLQEKVQSANTTSDQNLPKSRTTHAKRPTPAATQRDLLRRVRAAAKERGETPEQYLDRLARAIRKPEPVEEAILAPREPTKDLRAFLRGEIGEF